MRLINKIIRIMTHPSIIGVRFMLHTSRLWKDDVSYLKRLFYYKMGYKLDLKNPLTYNAKLQWLKIYDKNPSFC